MSEKPLEVGEIGMLQNLDEPTGELQNGMLAEVTAIVSGPVEVEGGEIWDAGWFYRINVIAPIAPLTDGWFWGCGPHEIRRITDPDAEQNQETSEEIKV